MNRSLNSNANLTSFGLKNVAALADNEAIEYGDPCYTSGSYDANWPETVVCDNPCKRENWNPEFWTRLSYCK